MWIRRRRILVEQIEQVAQAKRLNSQRIMEKPNVVGVGVGYRERAKRITDELCVLAMVRRKLPASALKPEDLVPRQVNEVPTDVIEVGVLQALQPRTDRWRPAPGGVSIGHYQITAGTLGCVVRDKTTGDRLVLSNNHVLANINAGRSGDPILQPGSIDGGVEGKDMLAVLERFVPLRFGEEPPKFSIARLVEKLANVSARVVGSSHRLRAFRTDPQAVNQVDAALARPLDDSMVLDEIIDIGVVGGITPPQLGLGVRKSGRSSGYSMGEIRVIDAFVKVNYDNLTADFDGQIITGPMSQPGDSGALLVLGDGLLAVGLLFAGSQQATVFNPIQPVLRELDVVL
jgi:hypothetical protein